MLISEWIVCWVQQREKIDCSEKILWPISTKSNGSSLRSSRNWPKWQHFPLYMINRAGRSRMLISISDNAYFNPSCAGARYIWKSKSLPGAILGYIDPGQWSARHWKHRYWRFWFTSISAIIIISHPDWGKISPAGSMVLLLLLLLLFLW